MDLGFTLAKDETLIRKVNRHWISLAPVVVAAGAIVILVFGLTYLFSRYRSSVPSSITGAGLIVLVIILLAVAVAMLWAGFWVYKRNFLVLTNQHLVRVEQKGLFTHSVSQLSLGRVQDVSGKVSGLMATVLGFGDITVETAGAEDNFVFNTISNPAAMAAACLQAHEQFTPGSGDAPAVSAPAPAPVPAVSMPAPPPGMVEEVVYVPAPAPTPPSSPESTEPE